MAGAGVAAGLAEQAHDVALEIDVFDLAAAGDVDAGSLRLMATRKKLLRRLWR